MLNIEHEQSRKAVNLETRTEGSLESAGEDESTFFAVGKPKDYDCAAFIRKFTESK